MPCSLASGGDCAFDEASEARPRMGGGTVTLVIIIFGIPLAVIHVLGIRYAWKARAKAKAEAEAKR